MTDQQNTRELLELAAKALGNKIEFHNVRRGGDAAREVIIMGGTTWNPLEDDGDALRLIAKRHIEIEFDADHDGLFVQCIAICPVSLLVCGDKEYVKGDGDDAVAAAIRLAATNTAAQIGRAMQDG